ncbi:hypothetical protein G7Y89_g5708 [Cudoniella acicularis]|uniref:Uncharacterized protein n=1 Tax=Cudoniella acicularis TaxID=354080 RepID=A0A8H4RND1_9HELO|nr:hypothetical protein G7Y89_g5708 [Cudoniella acicularis]
MATLSTLMGWAIIIGLAGGYWYYYTNLAHKNRRLASLKQAGKPIEARKEPKAKRSEVKSSEKPQKKKTQTPAKLEQQVEAFTSALSAAANDGEDEVNNREFARQLQNVKSGTIITGKSQTSAKQKSVKQSRAQETQVDLSSDNATAPSSATGGDADDDQSSLNSPELNATAMASPVTNGGVSDMLEQPTPGPSVLKITEPTTPARPKKAKAPATFEAVETKKQRQNRKKAEAKKEAREEEEKERKILMEKQRRTAREAEGRAAKDGSAFMAAKAPIESAWTAPSAGTGNGTKSVENNVQLLDTYEPSAVKAPTPATVPAEALYSESEQAGSDWQHNFSALPSEEEQTRIAIEESDNWKTVKAKERRKRENKPTAKDDKQSSADEQNDYGVPAVIEPTGPGKKWEATLVHVEPNGDVVEREKELQDSEWEVALVSILARDNAIIPLLRLDPPDILTYSRQVLKDRRHVHPLPTTPPPIAPHDYRCAPSIRYEQVHLHRRLSCSYDLAIETGSPLICIFSVLYIFLAAVRALEPQSETTTPLAVADKAICGILNLHALQVFCWHIQTIGNGFDVNSSICLNSTLPLSRHNTASNPPNPPIITTILQFQGRIEDVVDPSNSFIPRSCDRPSKHPTLQIHIPDCLAPHAFRSSILFSVAFYVLSCSTCAKINHRRKAKIQAKRERAEKHALETEQPGLYRHPSPFSTNPYWTEEIMMGPGPPKPKGDKGSSKNASQRALNTAGQGSSYAGSTAVSTEPSSSPTAVTDGSRLSGDDWNRKRYQREDEALWGIDFQGSGQKIKDVIAKAGSSAGRLLEGRLSKSGPVKDEDTGPYYLPARNPPVNDLHPPVVSTQPTSKDETRWMLQPPPPAKVMEGKVRVNRSRASSDGSNMKNSPSRRGETPSRGESRSRTSRPKPKRHEGNRSTSPESSEDSNSTMRTKRKPPPLPISTSPQSSRDAIEHIPIPSGSSALSPVIDMKERLPRPLLTTIVSSSTVIPKASSGDDNYMALRELSPQSTNSPLNSRAASPAPKLPPKVNTLPAPIPNVE